MYKVLLVDDEYSALEYIENIITRRCTGFQVAKTAESAEECLELLEKIDVDVLITDIRMTGMNGIELIEKIKKISPGIRIIIVSGYSDFEYAQKAIANQVYDYILKPVEPAEFAGKLERLRQMLRERDFANKSEILKSICQGEDVEEKKLYQWFGEERYCAFLLRSNNLPGRYQSRNTSSVVSNAYESFIIYAWDENEALFLVPEPCLQAKLFLDEIIEKTGRKYREGQGFLTVVSSERPFAADEMKEVIKKIYEVMHKNLVCGLDQKMDIRDQRKPACVGQTERECMRRIEHHLNIGKQTEARTDIRLLCQTLRDRRIPQIQVENILRQVCNWAWMNQEESRYDSDKEYLLEDLFCNSLNMDELCENLVEFLFPDEQTEDYKIDTPEYFQKVCRYINNHLSEPLSLGKMVEEFHVSQGYLSYIFRKYAKMSFHTYLTNSRIEKAKEILEREEHILIREAASRVGFSDQFYFSRVFKLYTGMRPTEYTRKES